MIDPWFYRLARTSSNAMPLLYAFIAALILLSAIASGIGRL